MKSSMMLRRRKLFDEEQLKRRPGKLIAQRRTELDGKDDKRCERSGRVIGVDDNCTKAKRSTWLAYTSKMTRGVIVGMIEVVSTAVRHGMAKKEERGRTAFI